MLYLSPMLISGSFFSIDWPCLPVQVEKLQNSALLFSTIFWRIFHLICGETKPHDELIEIFLCSISASRLCLSMYAVHACIFYSTTFFQSFFARSAHWVFSGIVNPCFDGSWAKYLYYFAHPQYSLVIQLFPPTGRVS